MLEPRTSGEDLIVWKFALLWEGTHCPKCPLLFPPVATATILSSADVNFLLKVTRFYELLLKFTEEAWIPATDKHLAPCVSDVTFLDLRDIPDSPSVTWRIWIRLYGCLIFEETYKRQTFSTPKLEGQPGTSILQIFRPGMICDSLRKLKQDI